MPDDFSQFNDLRPMFAALSDDDWKQVCEASKPAEVSQNFKPPNHIMKTLAGMWADPASKQIIDWILSLTVHAPYPMTGQSTEELAYAAAKHQARVAVGQVVIKAILNGQELIKNSK